MAVTLTIEKRKEIPKSTVGGRNKWATHLIGIMDSRGEWHKIAEFDEAKHCAPKAAYLRKAIPDKLGGEWEFAPRGGELFARYLGGASANGKPKKRNRNK